MTRRRTGEIVVILNSKEKKYQYADLSVSFESSDEDILNAVAPLLLEQEGFNIREEQEDESYTLKRVEDSQSIFLFPKSTAGC